MSRVVLKAEDLAETSYQDLKDAGGRNVVKDVVDLGEWFDRGKARGHAHMCVVKMGTERWPVYLNKGDGQRRLEELMRSTRGDGGHVIEVYNLKQDRNTQIDMTRAWERSWDFKKRAKIQAIAAETGQALTGPTLAGKSDFKGLRYYGVRYNGGFWVRSREMTYCFTPNPNPDLFTKDPTRAKVWVHTRLVELKKVIKAGTGSKAVDWSMFEIVNMHTGAAEPLTRILMQDKLTF
jgi:hypothetical protein